MIGKHIVREQSANSVDQVAIFPHVSEFEDIRDLYISIALPDI